jgi:hypothetical protein
MVKIFTMVKDEVDIVEEWVVYHGHIFGFKNLYVIDNFSTDGTYQLLNTLKIKYDIHITRLIDYAKKGEYMTSCVKQICKKEFGFPIDIDEFIVHYDKQTNKISCEKSLIMNYINSLPNLGIFKMNYIWNKLTNANGYTNAATDCTTGYYSDYGFQAKTFFRSNLFNGNIDHGNHYHSNNYVLTKLCLVHFHHRNLEQLKKKIVNNVKGFGHNINLHNLKNLLKNKPTIEGNHHITSLIQLLENTYKMPITNAEPDDISLEPLNKLISSLISNKQLTNNTNV